MKMLIKDGTVWDIAPQEFPVHPDFAWIDYIEGVRCGYIWDEQEQTYVEPPREDLL